MCNSGCVFQIWNDFVNILQTNRTIMLQITKLILVVIYTSARGNEAAKILAVFPTPSISHQVVFRPLVQELAKHGHQVVVITTDPAFPKEKTPANITEVDMHDMSYELWRETFIKKSTGKANDLIDQLKTGFSMVGKIFGEQLKTDEFKKILKGNDFDLLILEALARPGLSLTHVLKVPAILVSSMGAVQGNYADMGAPEHPILYPHMFRQNIINLTMWDKITELYSHYSMKVMHDSLLESENEMIRSIFGADFPCLSQLSNNVELLFLNVHPMWDSNRPVPPGVIFMGGLHQNPAEDLPKDIKAYLDNSKNGVIYVSFGTNVNPSQLPAEKMNIMVRVLSKLPFDVLWKWDKDVMPGKSENIRISKWLPQSDLLKHPKVKLFVTQCGLQSTDEAITAGVPLIGIPILADQWYNVEQYRRHGIGLRIDLETMTEEQFEHAVKTVTGDESYRRNIQRLREVMRDEPQTPLERAVWWTEYLLRHGNVKHLRSPAANITWAEYLELELILVLLAAFVTVLILSSLILFCIARFVYRKYFVVHKLKRS